jgi:oxygen-independent coproporphyrinogen-3 oxidase
MLGLRLKEGISLVTIQEQFGETVKDQILETLQKYYAKRWIDDLASTIRLNDPEGFLFSNTILAALFECLDDSL